MTEQNPVKKVQRHFWMKPADLEYLQQVKEENRCISTTQALELIIEQHRNSHGNTAAALADAIEERLKDTLTRIRLASNSSERTALILLDMVNALCVFEGVPGEITVQNNPAAAYPTGKQHVEELKRSYRAAALERRKKRKK